MILVSSQNITSKVDKIFNALIDISPKLPIGVEIIYKILVSTLISLNFLKFVPLCIIFFNQTNY